MNPAGSKLPRASQGFTLIELLVATAVTAILVGLMISMISNLLTAYNRSSGNLSTQGQATLILDQLQNELESAVFRSTDDVMLTVGLNQNLPNSVKPDADSLEIPDPASATGRTFPPIDEYRFGKGGAVLKFFSSAPSLTGVGNASGVRALGYQIRRNPVTGGPGAPLQYMLYRSEIPAQATFDEGYDLSYTTSPYEADNLLGDDDNVINTLLPDYLDPVGTTSEDEIIGSNVIDFGIRLFRINPATDEPQLIFPVDAAQTAVEATANPLETGEVPYPRMVEIMVRILTPEGEKLIEAIEAGGSTADWWDTALANSVVFTRMVRVPATPL